MASNWGLLAAQQSLRESTLWKTVVPIKGNNTHMQLHSAAPIVIQQVAKTVLLVQERSNSPRQPASSEVPICLRIDRILVCDAIRYKAGLTVISNKV